ncbi:hypothetical protein B566_EDAN008914 [Ephemera danica]|nr:hypothetical protein B566_EDAN008914 [Ephemera danica]
MASTGTYTLLPSYQRFVNGVPVPSIRRSFRSREKCLILLVLFTFGGVCFGAFFYLPDYGKSNNSRANDINNALVGTSVYNKVYQHVQKAGEELLIPAPPVGDSKVVRHWEDAESDPHVEEDRAKLRARIEEDSARVLPRPQIGPSDEAQRGRSSSSSPNPPAMQMPSKPAAVSVPPARGPRESDVYNQVPDAGAAESEVAIITIPPDRTDHLPTIQGGDDFDDTTRMRRAKIKEDNGVETN